MPMRYHPEPSALNWAAGSTMSSKRCWQHRQRLAGSASPLFVRTPQGATLTEAGRQILPSAQEAARHLYRMRNEAQEVAGVAARSLNFAATHSLSFTFFPKWLRSSENGALIEAVQLHSDSMAVCEQMLIHG